MGIFIGGPANETIDVLTNKSSHLMTGSEEIMLKSSDSVEIFTSGGSVPGIDGGGPNVIGPDSNVHLSIERGIGFHTGPSKNRSGSQQSLRFFDEFGIINVSLPDQYLPSDVFLA